MTKVLEMTAQAPSRMLKLAEQDLGMPLRGNEYDVSAKLLSPEEAVLQLCQTSLEYPQGPFQGFRRVLTKSQNRHVFERRAAIMNGYMLLMPAGRDIIMRTLVTLKDGGSIIRLDAFGAGTRFRGSATEKRILSGIHGFHNPVIGSQASHATGLVKAEPGHVVLVNGAAQGGFRSRSSLHQAVHGLADAHMNVLSSTVQTPGTSQLGVAVPFREYTYDTWPSGLELLWHPDDGLPEAATVPGSVQLVQAAGYVGLRETGKVAEAMRLLELM